MKLTREDYVARIRNATPIKLLLITFELSIVNLEEALDSKNSNDFETHVRKSQDFLTQLMSSLDLNYKISHNLLNIYLYVNKLLHEAYFNKSESIIEDCIEILNELFRSFEMISENENSAEPVMSVSQQIYAGLTYGNDGLNEMIVEDFEKGFRA